MYEPYDIQHARLIIKRLCTLQEEVVRQVFGYSQPNDCFCGDGGLWPIRYASSFKNSEQAIDFIEAATRHALDIHKMVDRSQPSLPPDEDE